MNNEGIVSYFLSPLSYAFSKINRFHAIRNFRIPGMSQITDPTRIDPDISRIFHAREWMIPHPI